MSFFDRNPSDSAFFSVFSVSGGRRTKKLCAFNAPEYSAQRLRHIVDSKELIGRLPEKTEKTKICSVRLKTVNSLFSAREECSALRSPFEL